MRRSLVLEGFEKADHAGWNGGFGDKIPTRGLGVRGEKSRADKVKNAMEPT